MSREDAVQSIVTDFIEELQQELETVKSGQWI
jgi:hypothetical protein